MGKSWSSPQCGLCRRNGTGRESLVLLLRWSGQERRSRNRTRAIKLPPLGDFAAIAWEVLGHLSVSPSTFLFEFIERQRHSSALPRATITICARLHDRGR